MPDFPALPSLNALRVLVVARHLNFRLAAEELGVTQAAVAQQVRGLEASLGLRLFERLPRGLALTDAGLGYSASIRNALAMIDEATRLLRHTHLTVSVTPTFASKCRIPRLGAFAERHPDIDLRVLATDRLSHFGTDSVDVAVWQPGRAGLNSERLMEQRIRSQPCPNYAPTVRARSSCCTMPTISGPGSWPSCSPARSTQRRNLRFNQTSLVIDAALSGQGLGQPGLCQRGHRRWQAEAGVRHRIAYLRFHASCSNPS